MLSKEKRLQLFLKRLKEASPAKSGDEAFTLLSDILNAVEDEFSSTPNNPANWETDGRIYPPNESFLRTNPSQPSVRRYRHKQHNTFIGQNGSIRIETLEKKIIFEKQGNDGRKTEELDK